MQRVTVTLTRCHTPYHTFSLILIRVGYNAMHYHNFNILAHALPHALPYIFPLINMAIS